MKKCLWLTVVCVNWGRGYKPGEFKANVENVMEFVDGREHVVILPQELDEADRAPEKIRFKSMLESGTELVGWRTNEPIVLSPSFSVRRERVVMTMDAGLRIGAPAGTGPRRHSVTCIGRDEATGIELGFGNTHPHRNLPNRVVQKAREEGEEIFSEELTDLYKTNTSTIWGADANDRDFPMMITGEKTAIYRGFDLIRFKEHPRGANLELLNTGTLKGTIDPHWPIWARYKVTAR